jgi:branched-chain amino acid transport system ATP-binding protein
VIESHHQRGAAGRPVAAGVIARPPPGPMRLEAHEITVQFDGLTALDGVSMTVERGEVAGLIGPNGSGKTTLLNVMSGVLRPSSGSVSLGGHRWSSTTCHRAARLGIRRTFQTVRLFEDMTVLETVEVPAAVLSGRRDRRRLALSVLEELGLAQQRDRIATQLPYGLQRRLEIARALAGEPRFLLLDEPAAGLTRSESEELVRTIVAIRDRRGCGILLIDHDLRVITAACSRVTVLNEGSVISAGTPETVRRDRNVIRAYLG